MFYVAAISILITMSLAMIRAIYGPTVFDRVLALNMFGTKTVLLICVIGFLTERTDFLDLGLLYSLMNFIGMVALWRRNHRYVGCRADYFGAVFPSPAGRGR